MSAVRRPVRGASSRLPEELSRTELAIRAVYGVLLPSMSRNPSEGRLGIARPSYSRAFVRTHETIVDLAEELGEWWVRVREWNEESAVSDWRRIERRHMEDAALEIVAAIDAMEQPVREVLVARGTLWGWRRVFAALPGRVVWSVQDDYRRGLAMLWRDRGDMVRRIV